MVDPLSEVVTLLQPSASFSKIVGCAGRWRVRRAESGQPFYCLVVDGACWLAVDGYEPITLVAGDFVLIPSGYGRSMSSLEAPTPKDTVTAPVQLEDGEFRLGERHGPADVRFLIGHCVFGSPDAALLVSLLPKVVHIRGDQRLATIAQLVGEESRAMRPARDVILARLLEVLLIEALRSTAGTDASPGLLRGLADDRLSAAIRRMHENPRQAWTVPQLAKEAALSRSAFFERFSRAVGVPPMEYLLGWRMAMAKHMLLRKEGSVAEVAERVGYGSASAFSVAFTRFVGVPPTRYCREQAEDKAGQSPAAPNSIESEADADADIDTDTGTDALEDPALLRRLLRAKDRMDAASHEAWPVKRLAKVSGVSEAHFARSFKRAFGLPPHRYLLTRRIEQATTLLRDTDMSITEIAFATGWESLGTFGRIFRDVTGQNPGALRQQAQMNIPNLALMPACVAKAAQRPDLKVAVSEKRRRAAADTVPTPTKEAL
jgi:transcriptional regulator GlxA family with amidase domain